MSDNRDTARAALDDAVAAYNAALSEDREDIMSVGAWVLSLYAPTVNSESAYVVETAPGQPFHVSVGLARFAQLHFEDDDDD